jgi:hypothetical protein
MRIRRNLANGAVVVAVLVGGLTVANPAQAAVSSCLTGQPLLGTNTNSTRYYASYRGSLPRGAQFHFKVWWTMNATQDVMYHSTSSTAWRAPRRANVRKVAAHISVPYGWGRRVARYCAVWSGRPRR